MAKSSSKSHREAVERVREGHAFKLDLPVVGRVHIPPPEQLAFYGTLGALAAVELIEWPVALVLAAGHALIQNEHSRVAREIGDALEDA